MASSDRTYSAKKAADICAALAAGRSLREICAHDPRVPAETTIRLWAVDDVDGFAARYARARDVQADHYADKIFDWISFLIAQSFELLAKQTSR